jgi:mRNA-degrading endonuclease RelE of RelBE toxin-antitoxin system
MYKVKIHKSAAKYYSKLDSGKKKRVNKAIEEISHNPFEGLHIRRLRGRLEGKVSI